MLELEMSIMGQTSMIHPTLLYDDTTAILVDVGIPGQLKEIQAAMDKAGVPFANLQAVILTHQDIDHVGSIEEVLDAKGGNIDVYAHAEDKPYIEGDKEPIKLNRAQVEQMLANMPAEMRKQAEAMLLNRPTAKVTQVVEDGTVLPFFGGITVIFTPGHTPGHISLYLQASKTLVTGDALVSENGKVLGPNAQATPDMGEAIASMQKFLNFDIEKVICYHGGLCADNVNQQLRELAQTLTQ